VKLSRAIQEFVQETRMGKSPETARAYDGDLKNLLPFARPDSVLVFNEDLLTSAFMAMSSRNLGMNTLYRKASCYRQFAQWALHKRYILHDPTRDPKFRFKMRRGIPRPFEEQESGRLMALPLVGVEPVMRALLYYTGLRNSPVCSLRYDSISFAPLTIETDEGRYSVPGTVRSLNKGQHELVTPMAPELAPILAGWIAGNPGQPYDALLRYPNGRQYRNYTLDRIVSRWGRDARVTNCTPHRFRHTYATDLLRRGVRLEVVQKLLGHASITTTMIYTKIADASMVAAILARSR
jgi:site-specific recombinase XerD